MSYTELTAVAEYVNLWISLIVGGATIGFWVLRLLARSVTLTLLAGMIGNYLFLTSLGPDLVPRNWPSFLGSLVILGIAGAAILHRGRSEEEPAD